MGFGFCFWLSMEPFQSKEKARGGLSSKLAVLDTLDAVPFESSLVHHAKQRLLFMIFDSGRRVNLPQRSLEVQWVFAKAEVGDQHLTCAMLPLA